MIAVLRIWPATDIMELTHGHPDLPDDHPHLAAHGPDHGPDHARAFIIDDLHRRWPRAA